MRSYFADAWFFIALFDRRDSHHRIATRLAAGISGDLVVTHDAVLYEVLAYFAEEGAQARRIASEGVRSILLRYDVVPADRTQFIGALGRYERRPDKEYSLTDCMSMVIMEQRSIQHVLTNDHHFEQAGFIIVNS